MNEILTGYKEGQNMVLITEIHDKIKLSKYIL